MSQIINKYTDDFHLGIWEISEDYTTLVSNIDLSDQEKEKLITFKSSPRKLEWLSVRVLLKNMLNFDVRIIYNGNQKPFLECNSYNISISHSNNLSSILLSKNHRVGIDLEFMSHRISSIRHKFINDAEKITENKDKIRDHLYIHWCAKEALYKICDKQDINFKQNLFIEPFVPEKEGNIFGWVRNRFMLERFDMKYFTFDNYTIVYTIK